MGQNSWSLFVSFMVTCSQNEPSEKERPVDKYTAESDTQCKEKNQKDREKQKATLEEIDNGKQCEDRRRSVSNPTR